MNLNPHLDLSFLERSTAVAVVIFSFPRQNKTSNISKKKKKVDKIHM
jgi:hypothetical protein